MTLLWTLNPLAGKIALRHFPAFLLIAIRTALAALAILPVLLYGLRSGPRVSLRDWLLLGSFGLFLQIGNQVLFVVGLEHTSVSHTAFVYALVPIAVLVLAAAMGQERFTLPKLSGMLICLVGVMLLARDTAGGQASLFGDSIMMGAVVLFTSFTVFGKHLRGRFGPVVMNSASYFAGGLAFQPVIWFVYRDFPLGDVPAEGWLALVYMAVFPAVIGYLIYYWALGHAPASRIAAMQYIHPPLATGLGVLFLGESAGTMLAVAGAFILIGVFVTERS